MDRPDIPSDSQPNFVVFRTKKFYQLDLALGAGLRTTNTLYRSFKYFWHVSLLSGEAGKSHIKFHHMAKTVIDTRSFDVAQDDSGNDPFSPRLQRGMHGRARQGDRSGSSYHLPYRNAIISRQFVQTVAQR